MVSKSAIALALCGVSAMSLAQKTVKAAPFTLDAVHLLPSPWLSAEKICTDYLSKLDPDRLLHNFRENAGLKPKADRYGGWESEGLAGHTLGHYLTAASQVYASTHRADIKKKIDYIVSELEECQKNRPDGYISAIPEGDKAWNEVRSGDIRASAFNLNGMWSPWYTNHKVLMGLIDAYKISGNKEALVVATKFADWMIELTRRFDDEKWQQMLVCEYGGINEALTELYAQTKKQKYLELAEKFWDKPVLDGLDQGIDSVAGKHSNTQIPKLIGLARIYEQTGNLKYLKDAKFFWYTMIKHHTYAIGGNSLDEYLGQPDQLSERLSDTTCETCNTYNMLKLTRHLFEWEPRAEYMDYYEQALINHILGSQDPSTGGVTYFMPLGNGNFRKYSSEFEDFTCCRGTGLENHTKYQDSIYFHKNESKLFVNLFIPSELTWYGQTVRQETKFPYDGTVTLTIVKGAPRAYELAIRWPKWAKETFPIRVNGVVVPTKGSPSSYLSINRTWKAGDKVQFQLPMEVGQASMPDNPSRLAFTFGPLVLAADMGPRSASKPELFPAIVSDEGPLVTGDPSDLEFVTQQGIQPPGMILRPFFKMADRRYSVYFDKLTATEWKARQQALEAEHLRIQDLNARTFDSIQIGDISSETKHKFRGQKLDRRESDERVYKSILADGYMEFEMKSQESRTMLLVVTYFGNERLRPDFSISVVGSKLKDEKLIGAPKNTYFDISYRIPLEFSEGNSSLKIQIAPTPGRSGPSIAAIRLVRMPG